MPLAPPCVHRAKQREREREDRRELGGEAEGPRGASASISGRTNSNISVLVLVPHRPASVLPRPPSRPRPRRSRTQSDVLSGQFVGSSWLACRRRPVMLPKVANQLFHHTSRAVVSIQNQTGHTLRNVLQLQSSGPSTAVTGWGSSVSGGSAHSGPGPSKFHTSSRLHTTPTVSHTHIIYASVLSCLCRLAPGFSLIRNSGQGTRREAQRLPRSFAASFTKPHWRCVFGRIPARPFWVRYLRNPH